jgi:hypothetical protein
MLKWWHYSRTILACHVKAFDGFTDLPTDQAILQHYGWRSFFLDVTTDPAVASWFAGNKYSSERSCELLEDCFEDPVFILREHAKYTPANEIGCVYVLNRKALRAHNIQAVDLVEITTVAGRPRFLAQSAFMVGKLDDQLPDDCIHARVFAASSTFREYAAQYPDITEERLFPGPDSDPVLASLLSLPWVKRDGADTGKIEIDFFERGLQLPEYNTRLKRRTLPSTAYYRRFWIGEVANTHSVLNAAIFFLTAETLYHGTAPNTLHFPLTTKLLREKRAVVVEIDGLVRSPYNIGSQQYGKGIYIEIGDDGLVLVTELAVDHPGGRPAGCGITRGRYFQIADDCHWIAIEHDQQCDCGRIEHHAHHMIVAEHFEDMLARMAFCEVRPGLFASADVDPASDCALLEFLDLNRTEP